MSHRPALPRGAEAFTLMLSKERRAPEVSIRPPSPARLPPVDLRLPSTFVNPSFLPRFDQATTVPPSPVSVAEASSVASAAMVVVDASRILGSLPCQPPPI